MEEQAQRIAERLRVLAETSRVFAEAVVDYESLLSTIVTRTAQRVAETSILFLVSEDGRWLDMVSIHSQHEPMEAVLRELHAVQRLEVAPTSLTGRVAASGEPVVLPLVSLEEFKRHARPDSHAIIDEVGMSALLGMPLKARGRVLGVLLLIRHGAPGRELAVEDEQLAQDLADRAALAIDNARLLRDAERRSADLAESKLRLEEALRARDEFLSIASHELRTPLTPLQLQLEGILRQTGDSLLAHKVDLALRSTGRLTTLIDTLLDASRLMVGDLDLDPEELDLAVVARECAHRFAADADAQECRLELDTSPAVGCYDRARIEQLLANLLANAIKFAPATTIRMAVHAEEDACVLVVADQGVGIAPGDLERVFQRFERAASSRHYGGLGLGLYISRRIAEAHGGTIHAESAPGRGSTFTVRLPKRFSP